MRIGWRADARTGFLVLALFTLLAADVWRYTISWWGFLVLALAITAVAVVLLVRDRTKWSFQRLPLPLIAFLALTVVSIFWSFYPGATALGIAATWATTITAAAIALCFTWREVLRGLGIALRLILGLSLLFELVVSVFIRGPVLPFWVDYGRPADEVPKLLLWSRNELFEMFDGGRIQGIVGNASTLAFMALLALIVFTVQLAAGTVRRGVAIAWLVVAVVVMLLTRSATITVALVIVAVVAGAALLMRRLPRRAHLGAGLAMFAAAAGAVVAAVLLRGPLLALLGRSDDLTNRITIWEKVIGLAQERPAAGWGWVSYWAPWVSPFDDLLKVNGVQVMHAHNAWLDVWLQLGIIGLVVFGALVLSTAARAWLVAVDAPQAAPRPLPQTAVTLLPLLLLTAILVQSLAESRLLVEYGWALLVIVAVKTRTDALEPDAVP